MASFGDELRALGKRRIGLPELRAAWLRAHPEAREQPDLRCLLLHALRDLEREGTVDLPARGWDSSGSPALPRTVRLRYAAQGRVAPSPQAWLPALAFAADERHPVRRADLRAVNAFMLSARDSTPVPAPTRERSLQIFEDEKRLDDLRKGELALFEGRVTLADLHCYPVAPPLPYEMPPKPAPGEPVLVLENYHSYDSFRRWNREAALYAAIAYGGGNAFRQGAGNLDDVIDRAHAEGAMYLGDLDPAGARIPIGVNRRRRSEGRVALRPHRGLYGWLLAHGRRRSLERAPENAEIDGLGEVFPAGLARALTDLWSEGHRIPQESFGMEQLRGETGQNWRSLTPVDTCVPPVAAAPTLRSKLRIIRQSSIEAACTCSIGDCGWSGPTAGTRPQPGRRVLHLPPDSSPIPDVADLRYGGRW